MAAHWDASTISAVTALAVSFFALIVAAAQAVQQYLITGQLIRLCDSVVYGHFDGSGRRVWQMSQFRFRVLYTMPRLGLESSLWDPLDEFDITQPQPPAFDVAQASAISGSGESAIKSSPWATKPMRWWRRLRGKAFNPSRASKSQPSTVGEAAWASFAQAVEPYSSQSLRITYIECDADRCPPDLVTVPMPVSMRDMAVMALMSGMKVTYSSRFDQELFMQGEVGSITTARHPILGPILHFTPGRKRAHDYRVFGIELYPVGLRGRIMKRWLARTRDEYIVANRLYAPLERQRVRELDGQCMWHKRDWRDSSSSVVHPTNSSVTANVARQTKRKNGQASSHSDKSHAERVPPSRKTKTDPLMPELEMMPELERLPQDGDWNFTYQARRPSNPFGTRSPPANQRAKGEKVAVGTSNKRPADSPLEPSPSSATVEVAPDDASDDGNSLRHSHDRSFDIIQRLMRTEQPQRHETSEAHSHDNDDAEDQPELTAEQQAARERESERFEQRLRREEEREERLDARTDSDGLTKLDMFWQCQINIYRGTWATPHDKHWNRKNPYTCLSGAISVVLECLLGFFSGDGIAYTENNQSVLSSFRDTARWLLAGHMTYPAHGINARGGVIAPSNYRCIHVPAFGETPIPALELLYNHNWQVSPKHRNLDDVGEELNTELMRLDSWLSWVGRLPIVADGPKQLLKSAPSFVQLLMEEFKVDFQLCDLNALEGGLQDIQKVATNIMDWLLDYDLTEAEQVYVLIAFLRGLKVAQCVRSGPNTSGLSSLLSQDTQAHLV